ncbi:MAG: hypothetical protein R3A52_05470 [Polyangiales bacterium]
MKRWPLAVSLCAGCAFTLPPPSSRDLDASADGAVSLDVGGRDVVPLDAGSDLGPMDAGTDTGATDAAADDAIADAGVADVSAIDVDREEASAPDVSPSDSGPSDVGEVDAGPTDVSEVDAGTLDVGEVDAGPADAGPADSGPTPITVVDVDAGDDFTCAVLSNGGLYCWGHNNERQLGVGDATDRSRPTLVTSSEAFVRVSAGGQHGCAITASGALWCWGRNNRGQVGDGTLMTRATPVRVFTSGVTSVSAGGEHTCAVMDAHVYCWGKGDSGQVGDGLVTDQTSPTLVSAFTALDVSAGEAHSCARVTGVTGCTGSPASLLCWGKNDRSQVGAGTLATYNSPTPIAPAGTYCHSVRSVSANRNNTCAAWNDTLYCWGENGDGQLGIGNTTESLPTAVSFGAGASVSQPTPSVGGMFAFAMVTEAGIVRAWSWGKNMEGQLAIGATGADQPSPGRATGLASLNVVQLSAGANHACARDATGSLYCWGAGGSGRLGTGSATNSAVPTRVSF